MINFNYDRLNELDLSCSDKLIFDLNNNFKHNLGFRDIERDLVNICEIESTAKLIRENYDLVIVCGAGGSYLGARAVIEALKGEFNNLLSKVRMIFMGQNLSSDYINYVKELLKQHNPCIVVISKSGTTFETLVGFSVVEKYLKENFKNYKERIFVVTGEENNKLREYANKLELKTFSIPKSVGGRYSVLTPVGLLPCAICGVDIRKLLEGAIIYRDKAIVLDRSPSLMYALARKNEKKRGKDIEILSLYNPNLEFFCKWFVQLFGESEGKTKDAIFPSYLVYTQDLHSMGQFLQEGPSNFFETVISFKNSDDDVILDKSGVLEICRGCLEDFSLNNLNNKARVATKLAHGENDVTTLEIEIERLDEFNLGALIYFFMESASLSALLFGVNPFNQPGVEKYKNIFKEMIR